MSDYHISDQDIQGMLRYLNAFHPDQANEEFARGYLEYIKDKTREISLADLSNEKLEELFEAFSQSKGQDI